MSCDCVSGVEEAVAPLMGGKEGTRDPGDVPGAEDDAELPHKHPG